jgi:hypothetical protein
MCRRPSTLRRLWFAGLLGLSCGFVALWQSTGMAQIRSDESVLFFPTTAWPSDNGRQWQVSVHGWIFEAEESSTLRTELLRELERFLPADVSDEERKTFQRRLRPFLFDNERGKIVTIRLGDRDIPLDRSAIDGHFEQTLQIAGDDVLPGDKLPVRALTPSSDNRRFEGVVYCLAAQGISVVSDIDDTIKITEMHDKDLVFRNTFLRPFAAVEGMADVYRRWAESGAHVHYVSMSPWQLYEPLQAFVTGAGYPEGSFHLRRFRAKDASLLSLLSDPAEPKQAVIGELIAHYPQRRFILVGDSGQKDPEVYGLLYRRFPQSIEHIYIRNVSREPRTAPRYSDAFRGVPPQTWTVFDRATELPK